MNIPTRRRVFAGFLFSIVLSLSGSVVTVQDGMTREDYLQQLLNVLPEDRYTSPASPSPTGIAPHVSPEDFTWSDWQQRTGELPPDFSKLPSLPFLPDPLILDEGGLNIPVKTIATWNKKREEITERAQYWITGTFPPAPENMEVEVLKEEKLGDLIERAVLLRFGPDLRAELHLTLLIPPGDGPMPVFICPWKKGRYEWIQAAVRRGYIGCRYRATDPQFALHTDDSEAYEDIWWPEYEFATIMRWAWAASRAVDYLHTLDSVNKEQIALTGLSRNGKMALCAAAFDERIKAVVPISGGTGGENPFRYTSEKFDNETIAQITRNFPHWLHPRLRFFIGMEHKLPVDQNSLMALVAPRGLMLTSSVFEHQGNPWGIEQAYLSARKVYDFLGAGEKIALDLRYGLHSPNGRDIERYIDFFDFVFGRGRIKPDNKLFYDYSFSKWLELSQEDIDPLSFPEKGMNDLLTDTHNQTINGPSAWLEKVPTIRNRIAWGLGDESPSVAPGDQPDYINAVIMRPRITSEMKSEDLGFGRLYYPKKSVTPEAGSAPLPVVIYLHEYAYSTGFGRNFENFLSRAMEGGFAVYAMDQIGFGTRVEEGRYFYERFPNWSKMGRMVADVRWAVDALSTFDFIDPNRIFTVGYALGGTVSLYSAALDERIAGAVSVAGFTPMRLDTEEKGTGGIRSLSHLHGLIPKLGFFVGEEKRIPYDYHEMLAAIAPRPLLVMSPLWDRFASIGDVRECIDEAQKVYQLFGAGSKIDFKVPNDYNRFSPEMEQEVVDWLKEKIGSPRN